MKYYECVIYLETSDHKVKAYLEECYEPGMSSIGYSAFENGYAMKAFKDSNFKLGRVYKPFHDFLAVGLNFAKMYMIDRMPFFKDCEWDVLNDPYPLHRIHFVRQEGIRLHLTEKSIHEMPSELIAPYFERICDTVDVFFDDWFEPEGLPGECVVERAV